jgi:signal transduction histidine kinase
VYTDPIKLKVVLKNLITNALKFTDAGIVTIAASSQSGGVEFLVKDTGIGIAPEDLPHIFEPFHQLDHSTTRRYAGVGLGLYIVQQLLKLLDGEVSVESEVGKGSTFRVWIPQQIQNTK